VNSPILTSGAAPVLHTFPVDQEGTLTLRFSDQGEITLRACVAADMVFLRTLYYELRADELAVLPWTKQQKEAFLESQFSLQHQHYLTYYSMANFWVIEYQGASIGRFYLLRQLPDFLLVDISLALAWRNRGIGRALIAYAQTSAQNAHARLNLHVDQRNIAAQRLYQRLGFVVMESEGPYIRMGCGGS